jgi:hydroxymethylpyrimidine/phosphomethylpyrimidine kinase
VSEVDPLLVERQLGAVLSDVGADAIKIGMLGSRLTVELVARCCERQARHLPIVLDPVLSASAGTRLQSPEAVAVIRQRLLPQTALLTPNLDEAGELCGREVGSRDAMQQAADQLLSMGCSAVLIKGGHLPGDWVYDLLRTIDGLGRWFEAPRVARQHRGTGCTLASAIAVGIAEGMTLESAVDRAERYLHAALEADVELPTTRPPLLHGFALV